MLRIRLADFAADSAAIMRIRETVFVREQRVPRHLEMDERDGRCLHVLAFDDGTPAGTARIDFDRAGKIGRLAVLAGSRRRGIGTALMTYLHEQAAQRGLDAVWCHAQRSAVDFYTRLGYRVMGDPFEEAGIEHVRMERNL